VLRISWEITKQNTKVMLRLSVKYKAKCKGNDKDVPGKCKANTKERLRDFQGIQTKIQRTC
jgi:hypothetical protein